MANEVDYLPFATASGSTVDSQSTYQGSGYQTTGFQVGIAQPSQINKVLRQSSMMSAALANFISNMLNINVIDDGNLPALISNLQQAIGQAAFGAPVSIAYAPAPVFDANSGTVFETTLTGNMSPSLVNTRPGQFIRIIIHQDATGGRTFTPPVNLPMADIDLTPNATSAQTFQVNSNGGLTPVSDVIVS